VASLFSGRASDVPYGKIAENSGLGHKREGISKQKLYVVKRIYKPEGENP